MAQRATNPQISSQTKWVTSFLCIISSIFPKSQQQQQQQLPLLTLVMDASKLVWWGMLTLRNPLILNNSTLMLFLFAKLSLTSGIRIWIMDGCKCLAAKIIFLTIWKSQRILHPQYDKIIFQDFPMAKIEFFPLWKTQIWIFRMRQNCTFYSHCVPNFWNFWSCVRHLYCYCGGKEIVSSIIHNLSRLLRIWRKCCKFVLNHFVYLKGV